MSPEPGGLPEELAVLLDGRLAGVLRRGGAGAHVFTYDAAWRMDPRAYPLSLSLPLAAREHEGVRVTRYLRGLLSDDPKKLGEIAHQYGVPADDPFALLAYIGEDCPGAVQFVRPERLREVEGAGPGEVEWLTDDGLAALLQSVGMRDAGREAVDTGQFSLPGALPKLALARDPATGRWGRPSGRAATTHILKPPLRGVPFHNENEHLCLELARELGFAAAATRVLHVAGQQAIVVERYDREVRDGAVARLHQEDMSQALGADPALRYAGQGAPGIAEIVALLRERSGLEDVLRFVRAVALNWILAGTDAHARNYSLLIRAGGVALAPLYDIASALLFKKQKVKLPDMNLAMAVGGATAIGGIGRAAWEAQARAVRLRPERVLGEIREMALRMPDAARAVAERGAANGLPEPFLERFAKAAGARALACAREIERGR